MHPHDKLWTVLCKKVYTCSENGQEKFPLKLILFFEIQPRFLLQNMQFALGSVFQR